MVVARWPGARPFHAAVTSRLIAIAHRARVHACLLKTSLGTHESLSVCVCVGDAPEGAGASLSIRYDFSVRTLRGRIATPIPVHQWRATPRTRLDGSGRVVFRALSLNVTSLGPIVIIGCVIVRLNCAVLSSGLAAPASSSPLTFPSYLQESREAALVFESLLTSPRNPRSRTVASSFRCIRCTAVLPVILSHLEFVLILLNLEDLSLCSKAQSEWFYFLQYCYELS